MYQKLRQDMIAQQICIFKENVSDKSCRIFPWLSDGDLQFDFKLDLQGHLKVEFLKLKTPFFMAEMDVVFITHNVYTTSRRTVLLLGRVPKPDYLESFTHSVRRADARLI